MSDSEILHLSSLFTETFLKEHLHRQISVAVITSAAHPLKTVVMFSVALRELCQPSDVSVVFQPQQKAKTVD